MKKEKKPCRAKAENIRGKIMMLGMISLFSAFFLTGCSTLIHKL